MDGTCTELGPNAPAALRFLPRSHRSVLTIIFASRGFTQNTGQTLTDPSLIIYYPVMKFNGVHIVTNGDQTESIMKGMMNNQSFEQSLETREYEPDPPHLTPRISGIINTTIKQYKLSILKSSRNRPEVSIKSFYNYSNFISGEGHCIHTYKEEVDGTLLSFDGEPFEVPLFDEIEAVKEYYWNILNPENRISMLVKFIDTANLQETISIINKNLLVGNS